MTAWGGGDQEPRSLRERWGGAHSQPVWLPCQGSAIRGPTSHHPCAQNGSRQRCWASSSRGVVRLLQVQREAGPGQASGQGPGRVPGPSGHCCTSGTGGLLMQVLGAHAGSCKSPPSCPAPRVHPRAAPGTRPGAQARRQRAEGEGSPGEVLRFGKGWLWERLRLGSGSAGGAQSGSLLQKADSWIGRVPRMARLTVPQQGLWGSTRDGTAALVPTGSLFCQAPAPGCLHTQGPGEGAELPGQCSAGHRCPVPPEPRSLDLICSTGERR